ncbi:3'-5' exonuclease [Janthinobacterium agaricidamnosum]|uniref:DNA-directed DNA polymerase n=1 Tax=Janthinobacterium agaricidamnosum NBRC 102515 = DSM 9628 TaxID=1349767 RepID=W0V6U1_9BURK|nr:3'-5' exonuclease [Janthinobacterium agaricidamnosum]CDG83330.1 exonuclease, DNA polymerase III, epsilon subunit family domain protein [Janthinobacterium agaricidamnosum NBRC 102515 = DSM 9628]
MNVFEKPIVMIDFETTGLSPDMGDRITEVAALRIVNGQVVDRYVSLINCNVRIPSFITGLTGISQAMVDGAPPVAQVVPRLLDFIGNDALSAHNASFDEKFLRAESARLGLAPAHQSLVCSLKLSRRVFPGMSSYKLGLLSSQLGIAFNSAAHRAESDAEVAAQVLIHIGRHLGRTYGIADVDPDLLVALNRLAAAKVPQFLQKQAASTR